MLQWFLLLQHSRDHYCTAFSWAQRLGVLCTKNFHTCQNGPLCLIATLVSICRTWNAFSQSFPLILPVSESPALSEVRWGVVLVCTHPPPLILSWQELPPLRGWCRFAHRSPTAFACLQVSLGEGESRIRGLRHTRQWAWSLPNVACGC